MKPFILGLKSTIQSTPYFSTDHLCELVGFNTGNLAFHYAIDRQLGGGLPSIGWGADPNEIDDAGSIAIIPCANQVGMHADFGGFGEKLRATNTQIVAIGLGAQGNVREEIPEVPIGTLNWVRAIREKAPTSKPNISVRGDFTLKVLEHYGVADGAIVLGCPTLFINPAHDLGKRIIKKFDQGVKRIAVAAGHHKWKGLAKIEASLAKITSDCAGSYVGQSPIEMIKLTRADFSSMSEADLAACHEYISPSLSRDDFIAWCVRCGNTFFDIPSWIEHYRHFDFVVGTRIHGVMLALQAGIPAMCLVHDSRTLELCRTMLVPHVVASDVGCGFGLNELLRLFKFDENEFDKNRESLRRRYCEFLAANGLVHSDWLSA